MPSLPTDAQIVEMDRKRGHAKYKSKRLDDPQISQISPIKYGRQRHQRWSSNRGNRCNLWTERICILISLRSLRLRGEPGSWGLHAAHQDGYEALLEMQAVFGFCEDQGAGAFHDRVADLQPAVSREAVEHDRVRRGGLQQCVVHLIP